MSCLAGSRRVIWYDQRGSIRSPFAGDSAEAKVQVAAFLESLDLRPLEAGGIEKTYFLEGAGLLLVGLAHNGAGFDIALGANVL